MKLVRCFIRPESLDKVREKLFEIGAPGLSVMEARGIGKPLSQMTTEEGGEPRPIPQFRDRLLVEVVAADADADEIARALADELRTGRFGDGKIFILTVDESIRVRTGQTGADSLY
ncbi:MAG: P-II family nitrogen regulator [Candidatus Nitrospinota bacterium M3_3B_026]